MATMPTARHLGSTAESFPEAIHTDRGGTGSGRPPQRRVAPLVALLASAAVMAGCGAAALPSPGGGSGTSTAGARRATSTAGTTGQQRGSAAPAPAGPGAATADPAARYAAHYRPNGTATVAPGQAVQIAASDFAFSPNTLTVMAGKPLRIQLNNVSTEAHNFDFPSQNVNVNLPARTSTTVTFTPARAGTFYFYCNLPGHAAAGMVGKLTVR